MSARTLAAVALVAAALAGCGKPPEPRHGGGGGSPTLAVGEPHPTAAGGSRQDQKRAVAGAEASTVGPIKAEVAGWKVEKPKYLMSDAKGGVREVETAEEYLVVRVRFSTDDATASKHCTTDAFALSARLRDEFGNAYEAQTTFERYVGESKNSVVRSGDPVVCVWLFEKPIAAAKALALDVSGLIVGLPADEQFRFTIPLR